MNTLLEPKVENLVDVHGTIEKIIFNENDYMIAVLQTDTNKITFKRTIFGLEKGEEVTLKGEWNKHPKFGKQLNVKNWKRPLPRTKEKVLAFLSSSFVKGCGKKQAERIVNKLGDNAVEIIMRDQENCLIGIKGIRKKKAIKIAKSVKESYELQDIISELSPIGISPEFTIKLYKNYGSNTVNIIKENPYKLTDLKLVSFPKADEIAQRIGITPLSGYRVEACVNFVLNETCFKYGHCFVKEDELIEKTLILLNKNAQEKADSQSIMQSIYNLEDKTIIIENNNVYPINLYIYENKAAEKIKILMKARTKQFNNAKKLDLYVKEYQLKHGITLADEQKKVIKEIFTNNIMVLTGNPGTGKTTVVNAIIEIYQKVFPEDLISLSAPTGRASRKLEEVTNHKANTNHRLLGFKQNKEGLGAGFEYNDDNPLPHNFFIIDEMSMVDLHMVYALLQAIDRGAKILFIGDIDQLPSVNAGNVLYDLIHSGVPYIRLTEIFRQAQESQIITNAHRVNKGENLVINKNKGDMYFINNQDNNNIADITIKSALRFIQLGYSLSDILVLSPMRKGIIGTYELNDRLQKALNPPHNQKTELKHGKRLFREGDKVIHIINRVEKGVFNGDIGIITYIGKTTTQDDSGEETTIEIIECDYQGLTVTYTKDEWREIELGYSITIHKSQGGQAPIVIMPISTSHYIMLARNLVYTGMTRAEERLVFIGQKKAMNIAISNNKVTKRNTNLSTRIDTKLKSLTEFGKKDSQTQQYML